MFVFLGLILLIAVCCLRVVCLVSIVYCCFPWVADLWRLMDCLLVGLMFVAGVVGLVCISLRFCWCLRVVIAG